MSLRCSLLYLRLRPACCLDGFFQNLVQSIHADVAEIPTAAGRFRRDVDESTVDVSRKSSPHAKVVGALSGDDLEARAPLRLRMIRRDFDARAQDVGDLPNAGLVVDD